MPKPAKGSLKIHGLRKLQFDEAGLHVTADRLTVRGFLLESDDSAARIPPRSIPPLAARPAARIEGISRLKSKPSRSK